MQDEYQQVFKEVMKQIHDRDYVLRISPQTLYEIVEEMTDGIDVFGGWYEETYNVLIEGFIESRYIIKASL